MTGINADPDAGPVLEARHRVPGYRVAHPPALEVSPGEAFTVLTADRFAGLDRGEPPDLEFVRALVGPIAVRTVEPGDVVAIEVVSIRPTHQHAYVLASTGYGILGSRIEPRATRVRVDADTVAYPPGATLGYRPMIGKIGLAAPGDGADGAACGDFGGALSSNLVAPGATLYLTAHHAGGRLFLEDVHARMGDGEATASAVEMAAAVTLRCRVGNDLDVRPPAVVNATEVATFGQGASLDEAAERATASMLDLICRRRGVDLTEAAMIVGAIVDLRIAFMGATPQKVCAVIPRAAL